MAFNQLKQNESVVRERHEMILLLKSPKESPDGDPFEQILDEANYRVSFLPILDFEYVNLERFAELLYQGKGISDPVIIFTSQQAVKSTHLALESFKRDNCHFDPSTWTCYVVGEATGLAAAELGFLPQGDNCGNVEALCDLIIAEKDKVNKHNMVLYPCGNISRPTLPDRLQENGIKFHPITVYKTKQKENVLEGLHSLVFEQGLPNYIVFFSPSGVRCCSGLTKANWFTNEIKCISIGPTTEKEMEKLGIQVWGMCTHPDAASLLALLKS